MKWYDREKSRINTGHYEMTEVLVQINNLYPGYFIHVAKADRQLVAYTQSPDKGERDIQTPIKLGVLMRKLNNLWTDNYINESVANHFAELNVTFELISGLAARHNYDKHGWGSCMSSKGFERSLKYDVLANFYSGDTLHVALVKDGTGTPIGRSIVDPLRKVYIRTYGDRQKVARALQNAGYTLGGYVSYEDNPRQYAVRIVEDTGSHATAYMPYLDHRETNGSVLRGCYVRHSDGSYTLALVHADGIAHNNLAAQGFYFGLATTTSGMLQLRVYSREEFKITLDGSTLDLLASGEAKRIEFVKLYRDGGIVKTPCQNLPHDYIEVRTYVEGSTVRVWIHPDTPRVDGYIDNVYNRKRLGYAKLDAELYPERQEEWLTAGQVQTLDDGRRVLPEDRRILYTVEGGVGALRSVFKTDPRLADAVKVHAGYLVEKAAEHLIVRTNTKVKVIPGLHEIAYASTSEGYQWMFKRSAIYRSAGSIRYWASRRAPGEAPLQLFKDNLYAYLTGQKDTYQAVEYAVPSNDALRAVNRRGLLGAVGLATKGGRYYNAYNTSVSLSAAEIVKFATERFNGYGEIWTVILRVLAEAMAVEYPSEPIHEVVQIPQVEEVTA